MKRKKKKKKKREERIISSLSNKKDENVNIQNCKQNILNSEDEDEISQVKKKIFFVLESGAKTVIIMTFCLVTLTVTTLSKTILRVTTLIIMTQHDSQHYHC